MVNNPKKILKKDVLRWLDKQNAHYIGRAYDTTNEQESTRFAKWLLEMIKEIEKDKVERETDE